jgi:hypothetical protein
MFPTCAHSLGPYENGGAMAAVLMYFAEVALVTR